jgi:phenylacetate-coenzyme A ligase PaaK-like adenylate-forming protein
MSEIAKRIDYLLTVAPFGLTPKEHQAILFELLKDEVRAACDLNPQYRNYVRHWPSSTDSANEVADLPYLPVSILKAQPPLSLVEPHEIKRILTSSSTTGQMPSRVALDMPTARRMTKGVVAIARDFIGTNRRPYLVVDVPGSTGGGELGARGAAIQSLHPFASEALYCLKSTGEGELALDRDALRRFAESHRDAQVLVYGFTYILWKYLVEPLMRENASLDMPNVHILHSGGWKLLHAEAVDKNYFNERVARVFGCTADRVIDFYGMVENVGVIYPDCPEGNKHVPAFADVLVRDPLTLEPVGEGEQGILQLCSVLPTSFPGNLLLTDDIAQVVAHDGCRCGRRGISFRFVGRIAKAEIRGCGNIERNRQRTA